MAARFKMKRKGIGELLRSDMVRADLVRRAHAIEAAAVALSPVGGAGDPHAGKYKNSWRVGSRKRGGQRHNRAVAYVRNNSYYARWVEYGTENYPGHHVLLRAARAGGGDG